MGVNPTGTDYPFLHPSEDIAGLLADLHISVYASSAVVYPLRVSKITGLGTGFEEGGSDSEIDGGPNPVDITIVDANGQLIFDSLTQVSGIYRARDYGNRLRIHEWFGREFGFATLAYCRVIQHTAFTSEDEVRVIPATIEPVDGWLHPRACPQLANRVIEWAIDTDTDPEIDDRVSIAEQTTWRAGYNVFLDVEEITATDSARKLTRITINAEAGAGLGAYDDCVEDTRPAIKKINNVPVSGKVQLILDPCHWVRVPLIYDIDGENYITTKVEDLHTLILGNDCSPCYQCEDFANTWKGVLNVNQQWKSIGILAEATRDAYQESRARWLNQKQCRENRSVAVNAFSYRCTEVDVQLGICNTQSYCLKQVVLTFLISINTDGTPAVADPLSYEITDIVRIDGRGNFITYELDGDNPYQAHWDMIDFGGSGKLLFHIHFFNPVTGSVTIETAVTTLGNDYGQSASTTFTLSGCEDDNGSSSSAVV